MCRDYPTIPLVPWHNYSGWVYVVLCHNSKHLDADHHDLICFFSARSCLYTRHYYTIKSILYTFAMSSFSKLSRGRSYELKNLGPNDANGIRREVSDIIDSAPLAKGQARVAGSSNIRWNLQSVKLSRGYFQLPNRKLQFASFRQSSVLQQVPERYWNNDSKRTYQRQECWRPTRQYHCKLYL
jgi:hypothetical protein